MEKVGVLLAAGLLLILATPTVAAATNSYSYIAATDFATFVYDVYATTLSSSSQKVDTVVTAIALGNTNVWASWELQHPYSPFPIADDDWSPAEGSDRDTVVNTGRQVVLVDEANNIGDNRGNQYIHEGYACAVFAPWDPLFGDCSDGWVSITIPSS